MRLIDTHAHLHFKQLSDRQAEVLSSARQAGIKHIINVGCSLEDSQNAVTLAEKASTVSAAVGIHPHEAQDTAPDISTDLSKLKELLKHPKVVACGEMGLDYFKGYSPRTAQIELFTRQIELCQPSGLPFIFHIREAWDDFWRVFDSYSGLKGVVHSFSAGPKELEMVLSRGLYVGLNGIMTFTKDNSQLEAARQVPLSKLLLETDAPFLTPSPFRGKVCEPKHVSVIARFLAELRGEEPDILATATTQNAQNLFGFNLGEPKN